MLSLTAASGAQTAMQAKSKRGLRATCICSDENRHRQHYVKFVSGQTVAICSFADERMTERMRKRDVVSAENY